MSHFIATPWLALIPAAFFAVLFGVWRNRGSLAAALLWLAYFPYEYGMKVRFLCSGECNIRIDLLLIYPVLLAISLAGILARKRS